MGSLVASNSSVFDFVKAVFASVFAMLALCVATCIAVPPRLFSPAAMPAFSDLTCAVAPEGVEAGEPSARTLLSPAFCMSAADRWYAVDDILS